MPEFYRCTRGPTIVYWEKLLQFIAETECPTFQEFSQYVHQEMCPSNLTTPQQEWYYILLEWEFDEDIAEELLPRIEAFENDYEKAEIKWARRPVPEDPGSSCQDPQIFGRDCLLQFDPNCQDPQILAKKTKKTKKDKKVKKGPPSGRAPHPSLPFV